MTDANGCVTSDDVTIIIPGSLFIPNTFTPNSDGYNDVFGAWGMDIVEIELEVYDRWGKLIWSTADLRGRWDGTFGGQEAPIDTYVWRVRAKEIAGEVIQRVGHVTLVR
jgi:gliding motility-associated-like protein